MEYLDEWAKQVQFVKQFDWILLNEPVEWSSLDKTTRMLMEKKIFPEDMHQQLCNNFGVLKASVNEAQIAEFDDKKLTTGERWVHFFKKCAEEEYNYDALALIV